MTIHQPTGAVQKSFVQAQKQAAAMAGPPPPWNAAAHGKRRSARWIGLAIASLAVGGVAGWLGVRGLGGPTPAGSPELTKLTAATGAPVVHESLINPMSGPAQSAQPAPVLPAVAEAIGKTPTSLDVTRQSGVIRIISSNASLADVVRALAQATHTTVRGGEALASVTNPVTLHWQGNDTAAAWSALLGRFASTAVSCAGAVCELWIAGVNAPRTAQALPGHPSIVSDAAPLLPPLALPQQPAPPPNSEENTETN